MAFTETTNWSGSPLLNPHGSTVFLYAWVTACTQIFKLSMDLNRDISERKHFFKRFYFDGQYSLSFYGPVWELFISHLFARKLKLVRHASPSCSHKQLCFFYCYNFFLLLSMTISHIKHCFFFMLKLSATSQHEYLMTFENTILCKCLHLLRSWESGLGTRELGIANSRAWKFIKKYRKLYNHLRFVILKSYNQSLDIFYCILYIHG